MKGLIVPAVLALVSLTLLDDVRAQGVLRQPVTPGTTTTIPPQTQAQLTPGTGKNGGRPQAQTFGATATVLLQCRRRAEPRGDHDFVVVASDRSGAALSIAVGDSCADALRELLDQGLLIASATEFAVGNVLYTLVRLAQ